MARSVLIVVVLLGSINVAQLQPLLPVRVALPNEAARGEIAQERDGEIHVKTSPCAANSNVVIFRQPYTKEPAGKIKCGSETKSLMQVVQR